jgi:hypothetical protein
MMRRALAFCALAACGGNKPPPDAAPDAQLEGFTQPDIVCPGGPSCASTGDGVLKVGAAKRVYTPTNFETYTDENGDKEYETTEPYQDLNGNGKFDGVWLFGGSRAAMGTTTDVEARAIAFIEGDVSIVIVYIDCIGLLAGDMDNIRNRPEIAALGIDHIVIGATHAHDAPDTVGLWGPGLTTTGREDFVINALYDAAAGAIKEAYETAQPAQMTIASTLMINDPANRQSLTDNFNKDIRDPVIFDPTLTVAKFTKASDPAVTIATVVNWADHPEVAHFAPPDVPATITAHYPHWLRDGVENGVKAADSIFAASDLPGLGGVTVFVQGALGGQIGSLRGTHPPGPGGVPVTVESHAMDQALGTNAAAKALTALGTGETVSDLPLSFKSARYWARIENTLFHVAFLVHVIGPHELGGYDPNQAIDSTNEPWIPLRATFVQIGPLGIETVPGELHPELWVGGYDQSWTWGYQFYDTTKPNLPKFDEAPQPPYMRDLVLAHQGVRYPVVAGLAEDYIGYIVPAYNYALDPSNPYINEAEGDHYEEVYSLGPLVEQHAIHPILQLLQYRSQ